MPLITFIEPDGSEKAIEIRAGWSAMEGALRHGVEGVEAECGGSLSCATCHVIVDPAWADRVGPPDEMESELLEGITDRNPCSRLSCQIKVAPALDGLRLHVPASQQQVDL